MKRIKHVLMVLAVAMFCNTASVSAQIYVRVRPARPHYERPVAPGPHYVWVEEDWRGRNGHYEWAGGHWVLRPHPGWVWVPGHWRRHPHGWIWIRGHWRHH